MVKLPTIFQVMAKPDLHSRIDQVRCSMLEVDKILMGRGQRYPDYFISK
jgi:hypothetical protein